MRLQQLLPLFILALAGCKGDRPDAIKIIAIERLEEVSIPAVSLLRAEEPVALAIRVKRESIPAIVDLAARIEFIVFSCGREYGRGYQTELYGDGLPLGPRWRYYSVRPDSRTSVSLPDTVTLIALVRRRALDREHHDCGRFMETEEGEGSPKFTYVISNTVRIHGVPAAAISKP